MQLEVHCVGEGLAHCLMDIHLCYNSASYSLMAKEC